MSVKVSSNKSDAAKRIQALMRGYLTRIGWMPLKKDELLLQEVALPSKDTNWLVYPKISRNTNFGNPIIKRAIAIRQIGAAFRSHRSYRLLKSNLSSLLLIYYQSEGFQT